MDLGSVFGQTLLLASGFTFGLAAMAMKYCHATHELVGWLVITLLPGLAFLFFERRDFRRYARGLALAALLTALPFALVHWQLAPHTPLFVLTGLFALVQAVVHFRFFLHIGLRRKREDLLLILFSTGRLILLAGGTIWIMAHLATRMVLPM